jgi:hypothetical protein
MIIAKLIVVIVTKYVNYNIYLSITMILVLVIITIPSNPVYCWG